MFAGVTGLGNVRLRIEVLTVKTKTSGILRHPVRWNVDGVAIELGLVVEKALLLLWESRHVAGDERNLWAIHGQKRTDVGNDAVLKGKISD